MYNILLEFTRYSRLILNINLFYFFLSICFYPLFFQFFINSWSLWFIDFIWHVTVQCIKFFFQLIFFAFAWMNNKISILFLDTKTNFDYYFTPKNKLLPWLFGSPVLASHHLFRGYEAFNFVCVALLFDWEPLMGSSSQQ